MKALTFRLRLLEPVLVSQAHGGEENSAVGLSFIPGSALRGVLANRYLQDHSGIDLATNTEARRMFLDGRVCCLNAYPWREETRLLPKPASWFTEKDEADRDSGMVFDWAIDPGLRLEQPKPPSGEFCRLTGEWTALDTPLRQINVHISLENRTRRDDKNKVYRYDALAEGLVFGCVIIAQDPDDLDKMLALLTPDEIRIGGAHMAGYGRIKIEQPAIDPDWEEYVPGDGPDGGPIVVTTLSDAILRGKDGQVNTDLNETLAALLKKPDLKPDQVYQRARLVAGFNRKWSLPLTQAWALQAGSVYVYPPGAFDPAELCRKAMKGVGERCAEGFGRLGVNWHTRASMNRNKLQPDPAPDLPLSSESKTLARQMAQRRLRLLLDRRLIEAVNNARLSSPPQNAQLSRVRSAVQQALARGSLAPITDHLHSLKGAREQFERARVGDTRLLQWIEDRADQADIAKQLLHSEALPQMAGEPAELDESLRIEYTARLIDGVMKKAARQNQARKEAV